jgi:ThiF family
MTRPWRRGERTRSRRWDGRPWTLVISGGLFERLHGHLFPGDGDEHGAVIAAGIVHTHRGTRLLAREFFPALEGIDFVPSARAYKRLSPEFVSDKIRYCRDQGLAYLAVHNHGGRGQVAFSGPDLVSHERGYPALLDIARGQPVGALVFAENAVAGDIWTNDGRRRELAETIVIERNLTRLYPSKQAAPAERRALDDRRVRVYGTAGQAVLGRMKVGVIGAGGIGMPIVGHLARLGVGHLVVVDPDRVEPSNLPRLPETTRLDAVTWLADPSRPAPLRHLAARLATPKVSVARRIARRARRSIRVDAIAADVSNPAAAKRLVDCDYIFLAADSHQARAIFNALVHQYLIPGVQIGSKVEIDPSSGRVGHIFSVARPVTPDSGCLWCNGLINSVKLTEEALVPEQRAAQQYVPRTDAPAPAVITLNAVGIGPAVNDFMLAATGLLEPSETWQDYRRIEVRTGRRTTEIPRRATACADCGLGSRSIRARGDGARLPVRQG